MELYKKDKMLNNVQISDYEIISSDIFDTLVLRSCAEPSDIFLKVGQSAKEKFHLSFPFSKESYKELRKSVEENARNYLKHKQEITFKDIFEKVPLDNEIKMFLMEQEILEEKRNLILNENVYSLLKSAYHQGKKVILTSDMYLSKEQIEDLLIGIGIDLTLFDEVFVSSELDKTKSNGSLYQHILSFYNNTPKEKILHIGDNYNSDVIQAERNGLKSIYYNVINENIFSIYKIEEALTEAPLNELRSLRKLIGNTTNYKGDNLKWYQIGAQIFGPVYALYCEWILDYAKQMKVKQIAPMMREGALFKKLLENNIQDENLDIVVKPLYVSRKATFLPSLTTFDELVVTELLERDFLSINDLFNLLLLEIKNTIFEQYSTLKIGEIKTINLADTTLYKHLQQYLLGDDIKKAVENNIIEQKNLFRNYLENETNSYSFLTVDLGGNGTIQTQINNALGDKEKAIHLIFAGRFTALKKVVNGDKLYSWMGYMTNQSMKVKSFFRSPEIIEAVTNIVEAGTSHYIFKRQNLVEIISNGIHYPEEQRVNQSICWEGILEFQKAWLKFKKTQPVKHQLLNNLDGIITIFYRLITYPTYDEARLLGSFIQDDQIHYSRSESILQEKDFSVLEQQGIDEFLLANRDGYSIHEIYWPQGVVALRSPNYFTQKYLEECLKDSNYVEIYNLLKNIEIKKYRCICIYGAGEIGEKILLISQLFKLHISYFIDRNYKQMSSGFHGVPVIGNSNLSEKIDLIIIASKAFKQDIEKTILQRYKGKKLPTIIGFD
ncbi:haloacid dehalogenase-like hydrolase [Ureibacillus xyleni]|uniref:Haloacid dehalogenase-like hydrolase n=1 Tax=Ureibacillus xyleni TaxID=614648 RepID=A0A285RAY2_9BACL|nr:HAD family hydrolase [Ureibacillus xyleni]SOB91255.1 haloacid dehalogenase-like hydrolase [Ureibacillus xyleni]